MLLEGLYDGAHASVSHRIQAVILSDRECPQHNTKDLVATPTSITSGFPGQANGKLASPPKTGARPGHTSPVGFDDITNQRQSDAETRLRAWRCFIRLPEKIEQVWKRLRRDTDP